MEAEPFSASLAGQKSFAFGSSAADPIRTANVALITEQLWLSIGWISMPCHSFWVLVPTTRGKPWALTFSAAQCFYFVH